MNFENFDFDKFERIAKVFLYFIIAYIVAMALFVVWVCKFDGGF